MRVSTEYLCCIACFMKLRNFYEVRVWASLPDKMSEFLRSCIDENLLPGIRSNCMQATKAPFQLIMGTSTILRNRVHANVLLIPLHIDFAVAQILSSSFNESCHFFMLKWDFGRCIRETQTLIYLNKKTAKKKIEKLISMKE